MTNGCSMKERTFISPPHFGHFSSRNLRFQCIDIPDLYAMVHAKEQLEEAY